jgi:CelD/BcsL family acetyltransferase involved in cellulose biosynthesis
MQIEVLSHRFEEAWDSYVERHPSATIYHALVWREIFSKAFGYQSHYLVAREGQTLVGCLPLFEVKAPWSRRLVAVPFRDRGGPLYDSPEVAQALVARAIAWTQERKASFLELKSLEGLPAMPPLEERRYWVRSCVDLSGFDYKKLDQALGPKTRNMIRQAHRAGMQAHFYPPGQGLEVWYGVYLRSQRYLGLPPLPKCFFSNLLGRLGEQVEVLAVKRQERVASACVIFHHRQVAMYAYSASDPKMRQYRPNDLMLYELFRIQLERGATQVDLGSDAPSQENLLFFKRKWLARQESIPVYTWGKVQLAAADSSSPRYRLARQVFRHLPLPLLDLFGRWVARYFG